MKSIETQLDIQATIIDKLRQENDVKVQLDDRWGRPSGLWSENGELILEGVDMEKTKAMIKKTYLK